MGKECCCCCCFECATQVYIWNYIEANLALFSVWNSSLITIANMLPMIQNPPVDYVRQVTRSEGDGPLHFLYCCIFVLNTEIVLVCLQPHGVFTGACAVLNHVSLQDINRIHMVLITLYASRAVAMLHPIEHCLFMDRPGPLPCCCLLCAVILLLCSYMHGPQYQCTARVDAALCLTGNVYFRPVSVQQNCRPVSGC